MVQNTNTGAERVDYKHRWDYVKRELRARPLLAYKTGIRYEQFDEYMRGYPNAVVIQSVYERILLDKSEKTARVQKELLDIVDYRGIKSLSKQIMVSDSYIRDIITGKKEIASYNIIDKIEIFLQSVNPKFELSIENLLTPQKHVAIEIDNIIQQIDSACLGIYRSLPDIKKVANKMKLQTDFFRENAIPINSSLNYYIGILLQNSENLKIISDIYIKR